MASFSHFPLMPSEKSLSNRTRAIVPKYRLERNWRRKSHGISYGSLRFRLCKQHQPRHSWQLFLLLRTGKWWVWGTRTGLKTVPSANNHTEKWVLDLKLCTMWIINSILILAILQFYKSSKSAQRKQSLISSSNTQFSEKIPNIQIVETFTLTSL